MCRVYILAFLFLFLGSCGNSAKKSKEKSDIKVSNNLQVKDNLTTQVKSKSDIRFELGDEVLADLEFIKSINTTCGRAVGVIGNDDKQREEFEKNCNFYKIKYNYYELRGLEKSQKVFEQNNNYSLVLNVTKRMTDSDDFKFIGLYTIDKNKKIDSLVVFSYENYIEALVEKGRIFYIKNNNVFLYDFNEDDKGIHSEKWRKYEIKAGKFNELQSVVLTK